MKLREDETTCYCKDCGEFTEVDWFEVVEERLSRFEDSQQAEHEPCCGSCDGTDIEYPALLCDICGEHVRSEEHNCEEEK